MAFLSIGAVFKNEANYLDEWLTFHSYIGVEKFYLYDDESTDNFKDVLAPWMDAGIVSLSKVRGRGQNKVYMSCLNRARFRTKWLALIDIDEFLWSPRYETIPEVLGKYSNFAGVVIRWKLFGSSGHTEPQVQGAIESFTRCLPLEINHDNNYLRSNFSPRARVTGNPLQGKAVFRPSTVFVARVHNPTLYAGRLANETGRIVLKENIDFLDRLHWRINRDFWKETPAEILRINHYWSRSIQELQEKVHRKFHKGSFKPGPEYDFTLSLAGHLSHEKALNVEEDLSIQKIWEAAKRARGRLLDEKRGNRKQGKMDSLFSRFRTQIERNQDRHFMTRLGFYARKSE